MSQVESEGHPLLAVEARALGVGSLAGVLGGLGMGVLLQVGTDLLPVLGAFAGRPSLLRGWLVHLLISVVYGLLFAVVVAYPPVESFLDTFDFGEYVLVGVTYAVMIAAVSIGLLPFVTELPWAATPDSIALGPGPGFAGLAPAAVFGIGHVVYGAVVGAVYAPLGPTAD